jgi:manganese/zinc/iron transport system permease protein
MLLVETLLRTRLVKEDASIGLVFPALFSVAVILIARHAGDVHLDTDAVLLGELAFAPFRRFIVGGWDLGPRALWVMGAILLLNAAAIALFYKELKLSTFDAGLAPRSAFRPASALRFHDARLGHRGRRVRCRRLDPRRGADDRAAGGGVPADGPALR